MKKAFYRCVDSNFTWWIIGKEYPVIDGCIQCDDSKLGSTECFIADLCCKAMKKSGAKAEFTRIERETFIEHDQEWFRSAPDDHRPSEGATLDIMTAGGMRIAGLPASFCFSYPAEIIAWRYSDAAELALPDPIADPTPHYEYQASGPRHSDNSIMQQADLVAVTDHGHLTPGQRKHIDAMEEKQVAKERLQRDAESKALQERADSLNEAGRAMERVKQDHGHRLGYLS